MPNIVAIVSDDRTRRQIEQYVGQFGDDTRLVTFKSAKEFEALYFPSQKPAAPAAVPEATPPIADGSTPPPEAAVEENPVDLRLFSQVHVILYAIDSIGEKVQPWSTALMKKLKERSYWPENNRTRLVLLKYEDDGVSKLDVIQQEIDDLIFVPIDRLVFLQKLEIVLNLPKKIKGQFLFTQALNNEIEISKICRLEKISDVGLAVRNPLPLQSGIRAKFYVQLPGAKETVRFFAKAMRSEPHPEHPGQYICYFSFFGVRKKDITKIRQWLGKTQTYKLLIKEDRTKFKLDPKDLLAVEVAGPPRNLVIIDSSEEQLKTISEMVRTEMDHVQVTTESSYSYFVHHFLKAAASKQEPPQSTTAEHLLGGVHLTLNMEKSIQKIDFVIGEEDKIFGHLAKDVFKEGAADWWKFFSTEENDLIFQDAIEILKDQKNTSKIITVQAADGERFAVRLRISPGGPEQIQFQLAPVDGNEMVEALGKVKTLNGLDALLIDTAFVPANFAEWLEFLKTAAHQRGLIKHPNDLKVILMSEREDRLERAWLDCTNVVGFLMKPLDTRHLMFVLAEAMHTNFTPFNFENMGWAATNTNTHMSREIFIEEIAEYGAMLRSATPFRPGSFFFLRKMIFDNAPNQCISARVYFCEPHPEIKGEFQISVLYYGINDAFLKYARTWIRENYAHSKEKQSS